MAELADLQPHVEKIRWTKGEPKLMKHIQAARKACATKRRLEKSEAKNESAVEILDSSGVEGFNGESVATLGYAMSRPFANT